VSVGADGYACVTALRATFGHTSRALITVSITDAYGGLRGQIYSEALTVTDLMCHRQEEISAAWVPSYSMNTAEETGTGVVDARPPRQASSPKVSERG
jgi:hypothetical protein